MTGILLIAVVALWMLASVAVARALLRRLPARLWRPAVGVATFLVLMVLPLIDEIIGGFQFRALCERNAVFRIAVPNVEGRVTRVSFEPSNEIVPGMAITIYHSRAVYTDLRSGERVVVFDRYTAKGGVLIRLLGISEGNAPLTLGRSSCSPEQDRGEVVQRTLKFSVVN